MDIHVQVYVSLYMYIHVLRKCYIVGRVTETSQRIRNYIYMNNVFVYSSGGWMNIVSHSVCPFVRTNNSLLVSLIRFTNDSTYVYLTHSKGVKIWFL